MDMWEVSGRLSKNLEVALLGMMGNVDCQLDWTWHHVGDSLLRDWTVRDFPDRLN